MTDNANPLMPDPEPQPPLARDYKEAQETGRYKVVTILDSLRERMIEVDKELEIMREGQLALGGRIKKLEVQAGYVHPNDPLGVHSMEDRLGDRLTALDSKYSRTAAELRSRVLRLERAGKTDELQDPPLDHHLPLGQEDELDEWLAGQEMVLD